MTTPISWPLRSRIGAAESWIEISMPRAVDEQRLLDHLDDATLAQAADDRVLERLPARLSPTRWMTSLAGRPAASVDSQPVELLGDGIQILDASLGVCGDDRVADRLSVTWAFSFSSNSWTSACLRTEMSAIVPSWPMTSSLLVADHAARSRPR